MNYAYLHYDCLSNLEDERYFESRVSHTIFILLTFHFTQ